MTEDRRTTYERTSAVPADPEPYRAELDVPDVPAGLPVGNGLLARVLEAHRADHAEYNGRDHRVISVQDGYGPTVDLSASDLIVTCAYTIDEPFHWHGEGGGRSTRTRSGRALYGVLDGMISLWMD